MLFWLVVVLSVIVGAVVRLFIGRRPRQLRRESHIDALVAEIEVRRR